MTMREENLRGGGKWETMNFFGVALLGQTNLINCFLHPILSS